MKMQADKQSFLLILYFMCVSSNDEDWHGESCEDFEAKCKILNLSARLGSSVILPCKVRTRSSELVKWIHRSNGEVVQLSSQGRIEFLDPRHGRVKVFPNQGSVGNYTIRIDEFEKSDLGCYHCIQGDTCVQVKLEEIISTSIDMWLLIYICASVAALLLLSIGGYYCCKECMVLCSKKTQESANIPPSAGAEAGASAPPMPPGSVAVDLHVHVQQASGAYDNNLIYENDDQMQAGPDHTRNRCDPPGTVPYLDRAQPSQGSSGLYPNLNQFQFQRVESQRTRQRFNFELFSRLRQASFSRHYYVNQHDLRKQQAMPQQGEKQNRGRGKKKAKDNAEYNNPIYNRSTEQLNRL